MAGVTKQNDELPVTYQLTARLKPNGQSVVLLQIFDCSFSGVRDRHR
jgi:hypothetical protein